MIGFGSSDRLAIAAGILVALAVFATAGPVAAQSQPGWQTTAPAQKPPQTKPPAKAQPKRQADQPAPTGSEAGLRQRVEQLEEQLVDLQVHVGTVESMSKGGPAGSSAAYRGAPAGMGSGSGADAGRIAALETQVQALTAQIEQMAAQMRAMQGTPPPRGPAGPAPRTSAGGFGQATVVPPDDPIANIINSPDPRMAAPPPGPRVASGPQLAPSSMGSRQLYDRAYTYLLQQNYDAAEGGFQEFLQQYPNDDLTPNAQFWLGETHFVRGSWDAAAAAFLKVAQGFPRAEKAPDSLAKFAMSMERKGNRPAACRALSELRTRYPNPPAHVRTWEASERRRANCT